MSRTADHGCMSLKLLLLCWCIGSVQHITFKGAALLTHSDRYGDVNGSSGWWRSGGIVLELPRHRSLKAMASKRDGVTSGASLLGSTTEQISYSISTRRNITIEITNYSKMYTLENPRFYNSSGYCFHKPPSVITKNTKEVCSFSKLANTACGAAGVLTYQILSNKKHCVAELAIMFSVPFVYNLFENWFALGIYHGGVSVDYDLFKQLYYGSGPFTRSRGTWNLLYHSGKHAVVKGRMSHAGQSIMKVEFRDLR
ncbi:hypothetical protein AOLI_G00126970 [Acnodon oligacanthus]